MTNLGRTISACIAVFLAGGCLANNERRYDTQDTARVVNDWLDGWHERRGFDGVVLVARGDEVLFVEGRGFANAPLGSRHSASTRFDPASIAKPFLATVILRLSERDVLDLEAPISAYLEELRSTPLQSTTLRQLLSHTAGVIDHSDAPGYFERARANDLDREALVEMVRAAPLLFEPGSSFAYSNFGYTLLALAAERVTGVPYPGLLAREITEPLGLESTYWNDIAQPVVERAVGFERAFDGTLTQQPLVNAVADLGSGDVLCTVLDLWRFERALSEGRLLQTAARREMFQNQAPVPPDARGYGLGWEIYRTPGPDGRIRETQGHGGLSYGFVSVMERDPRRRTFFAILSNVRPSDDVLNNIPPPDIRRMQADLRGFLQGERIQPPRRCLARLFLERYRALGYDAALVEAKRARTASSDEFEFDPNAFMLAAYELAALGAIEEPIRLIEYALETAPDSWLLSEALGDFLADAGRVQAALDAYRSALRGNPGRRYLLDRIQALSRAN